MWEKILNKTSMANAMGPFIDSRTDVQEVLFRVVKFLFEALRINVNIIGW
jgi:hypothetical protein